MTMKNKNLVLVGGGGHCKSVIEVAESAGYTILGILDKKEEVGKKVLSYSIIGTDDDIYTYKDKALFLVTVGQIKEVALRIKLYEMIKQAGGKLATLIASTAYVSKYAIIGEGSVVMHHAFVNAAATIGKGCIINTFANIEHDVTIGHFCHISTGAILNGNVQMGNCCFVGSRSVINNNVSICDNVIIGAGATIRKNILSEGIFYGNSIK